MDHSERMTTTENLPETVDEVVDNADRSRFELMHEGQVVAIADYRPAGSDGMTLLMPHTEVDADRRGEGLGAILVRGALDLVRARDQKVVPQCWFVSEFIDTHLEYRDLLAK